MTVLIILGIIALSLLIIIMLGVIAISIYNIYGRHKGWW